MNSTFLCKRIGALLAATAWATCATAQSPPSGAPMDPRARQVESGLLPAVLTPRTVPMSLAQRMQELQVPGVSMAVVEQGRLAWAQAWGSAQTGVAMSTETLLQAASISKPLSAVAALQLVQRGAIGLDADLSPQLRSWPLPPGAQSPEKPVTLRRLLSHSAGFTVAGFEGYAVGAALPTLAQVLEGQPPANSAAVRVDIPPGSQWRYSGGGYTVLQQWLQDSSGQPFEALLQQAVLAPAGMGRSFFAPQAPLSEAQRQSIALGHQKGQAIPGGYRIHPELAAAGLWTTPSDLARFSLALPRLLSPALLKEALTPQFDGFGLGFVLEAETGRYGHDGSNMGFESRWVADDKNGGRAVVIMANGNGARPLMNELVRAVAAAHGWADWMPPTHQSLVNKMTRTPMFLRGSLNDWGLSLPLLPMAPLRYAATPAEPLPAGQVEFKLASQDWNTVDLGQAHTAPVKPGRRTALRVGGGNLVVQIDQPGRYRFELDLRDPEKAQLRVVRLR